MNKKTVLQQSNFGQRIAEDETDVLATYFVETDHWQRLYQGEIDVVYGPKGSGKSALYSLLVSRANELFDRNILQVAAENPRGATAFANLVADPPTTEAEFVGLWKLYFACLLHDVLSTYSIRSDSAAKLERALAREGLIRQGTLAKLLTTVKDYIRRALRPESVEGRVELDPATGFAEGIPRQNMLYRAFSSKSRPGVSTR